MDSWRIRTDHLLAVLIVAFAASLLVCSDASAQGELGALRGRAQDADFFVPIEGVSLLLEGTSLQIRTDQDGNFFLNAVPPGQYSLLASKDGYIRERLDSIVVSSGSVTQVTVSMVGEVVELDEFVVSAEDLTETSSEVASLELRTELDSFTDVLGQAFISKSGASDAGKLLAKTTGVNVADGRFVVVRGLNDRYNVVSLNSLRVPSSDPDRRAVALDLFPSAVINDIRTSKTFLPDQNGESTGGTIDIFTKTIPDEDFVKFKTGTAFNTQVTGNNGFLVVPGGGTGVFGSRTSRQLPDFIKNSELGVLPFRGPPPEPDRVFRQLVNESLSPVMGTERESAPLNFSMGASIGRRGEFMGAPAGITFAADYSKKYSGNDNDSIGRYEFNPVPGALQGTILRQNRLSNVEVGQETMRVGLLASAGIQPSPGNEVVATYFFNRIAQERATLQFGFLDPDIDPNIRDYRESIAYTERELRSMQVTGTHQLSSGLRDLEFKWAASYNQSRQLEPDHRFVRSQFEPNSGRYVADPTPAVPEFQRLWRELFDSSYSFRFDVKSDLLGSSGGDGPSAEVKFGALVDFSERDFRADVFAYNRGLNNGDYPSFFKPEVPGATWGDVFLTGNQPVAGPFVINGTVVPFLPASATTYLFRPQPFESYQATQLINAGYLTFDVDLAPAVSLSFGARLESTDLAIQATPIWQYPEENLRFTLLGSDGRFDPTLQQLVNAAFQGDVAAQNDARLASRSRSAIREVHLLPALTLNWDISDQQRVRVAVSRTVARPSFKELSPVAFLDVESGDFFVGNSDLKMSTIMNYDVRWEWFPDPGSLIGVSFFGKIIKNPIELSQLAGRPAITRFINVPEGVVYGIELEFQRDLGFIGDEFRHFNLGTNYSLIRSAAGRPSFGPAAGESIYGNNRRLQGQPDYIFNFNLTYDNPETKWDYGVFYNITGEQLFAVASQFQDPDVFQRPFYTLDVGVGYELWQGCKVSFRAQNLLNAQLDRFFANAQRPVHSQRRTGTVYSLSLNFDW